MAWEKDHWRLDRRRLARVSVTPEDIGLCGCWQVVAVRREREELDPRAEPPSDQIGYSVTRLADGELTDDELLEVIREPSCSHNREIDFLSNPLTMNRMQMQRKRKRGKSEPQPA